MLTWKFNLDFFLLLNWPCIMSYISFFFAFKTCGNEYFWKYVFPEKEFQESCEVERNIAWNQRFEKRKGEKECLLFHLLCHALLVAINSSQSVKKEKKDIFLTNDQLFCNFNVIETNIYNFRNPHKKAFYNSISNLCWETQILLAHFENLSPPSFFVRSL